MHIVQTPTHYLPDIPACSTYIYDHACNEIGYALNPVNGTVISGAGLPYNVYVDKASRPLNMTSPDVHFGFHYARWRYGGWWMQSVYKGWCPGADECLFARSGFLCHP
jgi:hypothetical protein